MRSTLAQLIALGALVGGSCATPARAGAQATETNNWPVAVIRTDSPGASDTQWAGPFVFSRTDGDGRTAEGLRPFWVRTQDPGTASRETTVLYPLFSLREYGDAYTWSVFKIINRTGPSEPGGPARDRNLDVWPFYFSRVPADPARPASRGLFPIQGTVHGLLGFDTVDWTLFPLYTQVQKHGTRETFAPFPFVRVESGREKGFALWPVGGSFAQADGSALRYALWPLAWESRTPKGSDAGVLPFYTRSQTPDSTSVNAPWPFCGWTDQTAPTHFHETRYFWPFLVQGRGDDRSVSRWGPFYTHSVTKDAESTWVLWPIWHRDSWTAADIRQTRTRVLWFIASRTEQRQISRPGLAPATKTHVWPLLTLWDNGAGRRQAEALSPFEPEFADSPEVRQAWQPLFGLVRYDRQANGNARTSLFWDAISWQHRPAEGAFELHLGPVIGLNQGPAGSNWRVLGMDFGRRPDHSSTAAVPNR